MQYSIGVDIGGTTTAMGVVDKMGDILFEKEIMTRDHEKIDDLIQHIYDILHPEIEKRNPLNFKGIGIGAPNGNYVRGTIEHAPNLKWKGIVPLAELFIKKFAMEVVVTNDAKAAAIGEMMYGAAKGMDDFIMITLGTGVGSGIVANGKVIYGHNSFAGELGHTTAVRNGRLCGCGRNGCLETYASATGIVRTAKEFLSANDTPSLLRAFENVTAKTIYDAAVKKDQMALDIFEFTGQKLGESLANAIAYTEPEAIILFGGLARAGQYIFEPTLRHMEANVLPIYKGNVKLLPSELKESDAAILGSSSLIWNVEKRDKTTLPPKNLQA